jgi:hypothetical protein
MRQPSHVRTNRDVMILKFGKERALVLSCDSAGGIGSKPHDSVRVTAEVVGKFTARVALMEVLSVGAVPICVVNTLSVEPHPTGSEIIKGIRKELRRARVSPTIPTLFGSEKNVETKQTGVGVTILAEAPLHNLRIGKCKQTDLVLAVGLPYVGSEVLKAQRRKLIADLTDLLRLLKLPYIHELIPVGSRGILREAETLAKDSDLRFRPLLRGGIDLRKSAGPATVLLCSLSPNNWSEFQQNIDKPLNVVGELR